MLRRQALDHSALDWIVWERVPRGPYLLETSLPGVFAAGDARSGSVKRFSSAVGEGSMDVRLVHQRLSDSSVQELRGERRVRRGIT
jgi:NADPH-dependent glutamate synthase beta subunit-like oxidoreductase